MPLPLNLQSAHDISQDILTLGERAKGVVNKKSAAASNEDMLMRELKEILNILYADQADACFDALKSRMDAALKARPLDLKKRDAQRKDDPLWFARSGRPAYCAYIDRFAGTLKETCERVSYLKSLNVGLFHPLPLLMPREGDSDGGFAVMDYREVDPRLGTMDDLRLLAKELRDADMSLVLDVVCNHTAREHQWAQKQLAGDPEFQDFYLFKSEQEVREWEEALIDVFPDTAPGSFTYVEEAKSYVWTTFYPFQWDLNYGNPRVLVEMSDVLFYLANAGCEGFRLDSATFLWKIKGTSCRNLDQTHLIMRAWRIMLSLVAPSVFLLAEAIESLDAVLPFYGKAEKAECQLAYNNNVMTALWGAMADQDATVARSVIREAARKPAHGAWLNYIRCHDDIIWQALSASVAQEKLQNWSDFYAGKDSFAKGLAFQAPKGLAASSCGMALSLCGGRADALALQRLKMLTAILFALDGVPMIYMGDEIGLENDESFLSDPLLKDELRWLHRPHMDWEKAQKSADASCFEGDLSQFIHSLCHILQDLKLSARGLSQEIIDHEEKQILWLRRACSSFSFQMIANMSAQATKINLPNESKRLLGGLDDQGCLAPWSFVWLQT